MRRALDSGRSASDLHDFLGAHSRTPVPQPLAYLIDDVARKHGHLRIGAASAYVRCDDDTVLGEILADRRRARPARLAPTVLAAQTDPASLLGGLRSMGMPWLPSPPRAMSCTPPAPTRTAPAGTASVPVPDGPPAPDTTLLGAAVKAIRRRPGGDGGTEGARGRRGVGGGLPHVGGRDPGHRPGRRHDRLGRLDRLRQRGGGGEPRVIAPVRVEGGFVTGYDHTADEVRTYPCAGVGVAELADEQI
ncbi:helicase-associated domain-containing protein [Streptomyces tanashiensis]